MQHGSVSRRLSIAALCLTSGVLVTAFGQVPNEQSVYTLQRAIDESLVSNPGIRAAGYAVDIERARRELAALPAQMSVETEVENFLGSGETGSFDSAETTLQLSRVLELGDKRGLREGLGSARVGLAETSMTLARLDLSAEVARRFIHLIALQEESLIAQENIALAQSTLEIVRQRFDVGSTSEAELATAEIALAQVELEAGALVARLEAAGLSLGTLWGDEDSSNLAGRANLFDLPSPASLGFLKARVSGNADLLRSVDERRVLEAERRLAEARQRADLGLSFGVRRLEATNDSAFVVGASLPLGRRVRSDAEVAASTSSLNRLSAETEQRRLDVISVLAGLHAELKNAYDRFVSLRDSLLPRSEDAAALYREGFEAGRFSLLEFNRSQQDLLTLRLSALAAAAHYHMTLVDIEQLLGGTYESGVIQ
ncbi:MAG: TolC family protein [Gammaproteobacteria bacterium]|jgi:cobalt-zinc-cadmium efflux system outer membrane protein